MADCAAPQPERVAPEKSTSFGGRYCLFTCAGRTSFQTSSVLPRIAAAKRPISSWRRSLRGPAAADTLPPPPPVQHLGAADQDARIDAERPADEAEDDDGADAEAAAPARDAPMPRRSSTFSEDPEVFPAHGVSPLAAAITPASDRRVQAVTAAPLRTAAELLRPGRRARAATPGNRARRSASAAAGAGDRPGAASRGRGSRGRHPSGR